MDQTSKRLKKLYQTLGGDQGLHDVLTDFYTRLQNDLLIGFFFDGKNIPKIIEMQEAFLKKAMGVQSDYPGKPPHKAHLNLPPILAGHFDRRLRILETTLKDHGLPSDDIDTWIQFENAFRPVLVKL